MIFLLIIITMLSKQKFKTKIGLRIEINGGKDVKTRVPLKYLCNFWRTLEMPLLNCKSNLILTLSAKYFIINNAIDGQVPTFTITDTKLSIPLLTLLTHDNAKLFHQLKSGYKRTIDWNKYEPKITVHQQKPITEFLK